MITLTEKAFAHFMDAAMCGGMNFLQWRRPDQSCTRAQLAAYLAACEGISREDFYHAPALANLVETPTTLQWDSPQPGAFPENNRTRVRLHPSSAGPAAPTVILMHALMSSNDIGYLRTAKWFTDRGWNAVFPHLPLHYSRTPRGFLNGELAVTADLVRTGETLRQCVKELRQLMAHLRAQGCREFGLIGTSWGGWNAALLSFVEPDFRFVSLVQPIANVEHAIWQNPSARAMRRLLLRHGITQGQSDQHSHLTSPRHGQPLCGGGRMILTAGEYDTIAPRTEIAELAAQWTGAKLITVRQGHFGYAALPATLREIEGRM